MAVEPTRSVNNSVMVLASATAKMLTVLRPRGGLRETPRGGLGFEAPRCTSTSGGDLLHDPGGIGGRAADQPEPDRGVADRVDGRAGQSGRDRVAQPEVGDDGAGQHDGVGGSDRLVPWAGV